MKSGVLVSKKLVAPSILSADFARLGAEIESVAKAGADWIHVDVMDGHFVDNLTIGAPVVKSLKKISRLPLDVHLMISNPEKYLNDFITAGADVITFHIETAQNPEELIQRIKGAGIKAGITLRPKTAVEEVLPFIEKVDLVLLMTVEPGFSGQSFMMDQMPKLDRLRSEIDKRNPNCLIEVDGGVNAETVKYLSQADVLVSGNYVFKNDYKMAIDQLKGS